MQIEQKAVIHNDFVIERVSSKTGEVKQSVKIYNIVLDQMYTRLCAGQTYFVNIHFGTGLGTPIKSNTSLFNFLGTKVAENVDVIKAVPLSIWKRKIIINPEEYVGQTITEVGVAFSAASNSLVTHAMVNDSEGNPITITKDEDDVINIYATIYIVFPDDIPGLHFTGIPYNTNSLLNWLVGGATAPTGAFRLRPGEGFGTDITASAAAVWTADTANKQRKTDVKRFPVTVNGQVMSFLFDNMFYVEFPSSDIFSGQSYEGVGVGVGDGVQTEFMLPSHNIMQDTLNIKVDGVHGVGINIRYIRDFNFILPLNLSNNNNSTVYLSPTPNAQVCVLRRTNSPQTAIHIFRDTDFMYDSVFAPGNISNVAISENGRSVATCGSSANATNVYRDVTSSSTNSNSFSPSSPSSPTSVAINEAANRLVFGMSNNIQEYQWQENVWVLKQTLTDTSSGIIRNDLALSTIVRQKTTTTLATYKYINDEWVMQPITTLPTFNSWNLSGDGLTLVVNRVIDNQSYIVIYEWIENSWVEIENLKATDVIGDMVNDIEVDFYAKHIIIGLSGSGYLRLFSRNESSWDVKDLASALNITGINKLSMNKDATLVAASDSSSATSIWDIAPRTTLVTFDTPPSEGAVITADYTTKGIHKTAAQIIDVGLTIQFGEGV